MGRLQADEFAGLADIRTALSWHLSSNHYPPIPLVMLEPCLQAISNAELEDWNAEITLPDGILWRGSATCPTHALIEHAHLDSFISLDDDHYDEGEES